MVALSYTDIQPGVFFVMHGVVYETISSTFSKKSRQKGSNQVQIRNLATGSVVNKTFHPADTFDSVILEKKSYVFVYARNDALVIHPEDSPSERSSVPASLLLQHHLIPSGEVVTALVKDDAVLSLRPPIKVSLRVTDAPPAVRGNTAQGGSKKVLVETGASITTPLFIKEGEYVTVNTETGAYVERSKQ